MRITECRACGSAELDEFLALGDMPLADGFLAGPEAVAGERRYPLDIARCARCTLVQVLDTVPREVLFGADYPYFSSCSQTLSAASAVHARRLIHDHALGAGSLVVELACNDGYLLEHVARAGVPVLGVEPAAAPAAAARDKGLDVIEAFFDEPLASDIVAARGGADVVVANNVLAHVENLPTFVDGIRTLLRPGGVASLEVHHLGALVAGLQFDTLYHEHLCYFSAAALLGLLAGHGLQVCAVERLPAQGGSLRVTARAGRAATECAGLAAVVAAEHDAGLADPACWRAFAGAVEALRGSIHDVVTGLVDAGARVAAYGAAAKGTMLLNACALDATLVGYVLDRNPYKHGRLMPGTHQPIRPTSALREAPVDYLLLLPWNLREEILAQHSEWRAAGGRFVVPLPAPEVIA